MSISVELAEKDPEVQNLLNRLVDYQDLLHCTNQTDYKISKQVVRKNPYLNVIMDVVRIVVEGGLALPGLLLLLPTLLIVTIYSRRYQMNALRKSSVKINATDVLATGKLVSATICFLVCLLFEPILILFFFAYRGYSVTLLDYISLLNILPWFFYLTIFLTGTYSSSFSNRPLDSASIGTQVRCLASLQLSDGLILDSNA